MDAESKSPDSQPPDIRDLVEGARAEGEHRESVRARADEQHRISIDARRLLGKCAKFATPGARGIEYDPDESEEVRRERIGKNANWQDCNEEFCHQWLKYWVLSVEPVRAMISVEGVRSLDTVEDAEEITKWLYLELLSSSDPQEEAGRIATQLAAIREGLGDHRFELGRFFTTLRAKVKRLPCARQLDQEGRLFPASEPAGGSREAPASWEDAKTWLITKLRLLKVLGREGAPWLKQWEHLRR